MDHRERLEIQIEELRTYMYKAYENSIGYDKLMEISQQLDQLLNDLEIVKHKKTKKDGL